VCVAAASIPDLLPPAAKRREHAGDDRRGDHVHHQQRRDHRHRRTGQRERRRERQHQQTAATTRKVRIGRLVNRPITANSNAPNSAGTNKIETTAPSVTGPCPDTTTSEGIAPNAEGSKYTTAFTTAATAPASGPTHTNRPKATRPDDARAPDATSTTSLLPVGHTSSTML
jgi:hypothetical protein